MMLENKIDFYGKIANHIDLMIPTEWEKVYYLGEVEKEKLSWSSVFYFIDKNDNQIVKSHSIPEKYNVPSEIYQQLLDELNILLIALYDSFEEVKEELWEQVSLEIDNTGKFNTNYYYDKIHNSEDSQAKREVIWAYKTFGLKPKEGTYLRKVLDKYLIEN